METCLKNPEAIKFTEWIYEEVLLSMSEIAYILWLRKKMKLDHQLEL